MTVIRAGTAGTRYDILVGPLEPGIERILDMARGGKVALVSEPRVFSLHGHRIAEALGTSPILVEEGEAAKNWDTLYRLLAEFAERNLDRLSPVVALGGGSVGDVAGLAASLFKRGCPVVHVPTTLLSQADSAVGGKTAIDAFGEKNVVGTFHQPSLVIADPSLLDTLDERQLRSGYAEIVKYGLIDDAAFFAWCQANGKGLIAGHRDLRQQAIETALRAKARIVEGDERDLGGKRALLNLGHSFGHAIESVAGLGGVLHGEAVALGMVLAHRFSARIGRCPDTDATQVSDHLAAVGLPVRLSDVGIKGSQLVDWMIRDKKNLGGKTSLVLSRGIGHAYVEPSIDPAALAAFLDTA